MTANQLAYQQLLEQKRANLESERHKRETNVLERAKTMGDLDLRQASLELEKLKADRQHAVDLKRMEVDLYKADLAANTAKTTSGLSNLTNLTTSVFKTILGGGSK